MLIETDWNQHGNTQQTFCPSLHCMHLIVICKQCLSFYNSPAFILFNSDSRGTFLLNGKLKRVFIFLSSLSGCGSAPVERQESVEMDAGAISRHGTPCSRPQDQRLCCVRTSPGQDSASAPCRMGENRTSCNRNRPKVPPET